MNTSNTENKEQTFDEKLAAILDELQDQVIDGYTQPVNGWNTLKQEAEQAIKTLVLEDVIGEDEFEEYKMSAFLSMLAESNNILRAEQRQIINPQKEES